jgi:peptidylprolyl isomerase
MAAHSPRRAGGAAALVLALLAAPLAARGSDRDEWRDLDPSNTLVVQTTKGRIVVELHPELAPQAVARIKILARAHVYDGLLFHRVIDRFVDQTGNPNNHDGGGSDLPDLPAEFDARIPASDVVAVANPAGSVQGLLGVVPVEASTGPSKAGGRRTWGLFCAGVMGMGRQADENSANSEIFFMRDAARRLDHLYTVVGRVVDGQMSVRAMAVGVPPPHPDHLVSVALASDLPPAARPALQVQNERSAMFQTAVQRLRKEKGAAFSVCDVPLLTRGAR